MVNSVLGAPLFQFDGTLLAAWAENNDLTSFKDSQPRFTLRVPSVGEDRDTALPGCSGDAKQPVFLFYNTIAITS